jgi:hypothetical protein
MLTRSKKPIDVFSSDDEVSESEYLQDFAPTLVPSFRVTGKTIINKAKIVIEIESSSEDDDEKAAKDEEDASSDEVEIVVRPSITVAPPMIQKKISSYSALHSAPASSPSSPRHSAQSSSALPPRRRISFGGNDFLRGNNSLSEATVHFSQDDSFVAPFKGAFEVSANVPDLMAIDDPNYFDFANNLIDEPEPTEKPSLFQEAIAKPTVDIPITDFYAKSQWMWKVPPPTPTPTPTIISILPLTEPMVIDDEPKVPIVEAEVEVAAAPPPPPPLPVMKVARTNDENVQPEKPRGEPLDTDTKRKKASRSSIS